MSELSAWVVAPQDAAGGQLDDEEPFPPGVAARPGAARVVVSPADEPDPLLRAADLHAAHHHLAPRVAEIGGLARRRRDAPLVDGGGRVRDVQSMVAAVVGIAGRVHVAEAAVAGARRAPEGPRCTLSLGEHQQGLPVGGALGRPVPASQPHVGDTDGSVDIVLVGQARGMRGVGDVLELAQEVRRDEAPELGPVAGTEGMDLAVIGARQDDSLAVGCRTSVAGCGRLQRRWPRPGYPCNTSRAWPP